MPAEKESGFSGGAIFLLTLVLISLIPLLWLMVNGFQTQNLQMIVISIIFFSFLIIPFSLDFLKFSMKSSESYGATALSFTAGALLAVLVNWKSAFAGIFGGGASGGGGAGMSIFSVPLNYLLSSISGNLPQFWSIFVNTFSAAVSEEMLFLITIPVAIFLTLDFAGRKVEFLGNKFLQIGVAIAVAAPLFAVFHIGNMGLMAFVISAIIFRAFLIGMVWSDEKAGIIPYISIVPAFAIAFHMFNNFSFFGFIAVIPALLSNPFGWVAIIFIISSFVFGINQALRISGLRK